MKAIHSQLFPPTLPPLKPGWGRGESPLVPMGHHLCTLCPPPSPLCVFPPGASSHKALLLSYFLRAPRHTLLRRIRVGGARN